MGKYPLWKYLLISVVILMGGLYAVPNLYGEDPAIQVSSTRSTKIDVGTLDRVKGALDRAQLKFGSVKVDETGLLVRFTDTETQIKAQDLIRETMGPGYIVALNLAPATPEWMKSVHALPMYLGLDLRGGVHFLMEVDMNAAISQSLERYKGDFRTMLREKKVRYLDIAIGGSAADGTGFIKLQFGSPQDRDQAKDIIRKEFGSLVLKEDADDKGAYLTALMSPSEQAETRKFAIQQNITTLRNRVNELGVAEPVIQQQGIDRIVVQLPGVQDTARAKEILGATATLEFRMVDEEHGAQAALNGIVPPGAKLYRERNGDPVLLKNQVMLTGDYIVDAKSGIDAQSGGSKVDISLDSKGGRLFENATKENVGKLMGVVFIETKTETKNIDGQLIKTKRKVEEVINVARIREQLGRRFQVTGLDSSNEARDFALLLRAGALAAPIDIVEERTVGPSLGAENILKGFNSTLLGFCLIGVFMTIYYLMFGFISVIALAVNLLLLIAVLSIMQATLTLPGMAGIALTVGMAIDSNVLVFERIREELRAGMAPAQAITAGYERAWATIFDSNITIFIAGFSLFLLGSGPVRGFAVVLCIGILTSMFSAIMVSRALVQIVYGGKRLTKLAIG